MKYKRLNELEGQNFKKDDIINIDIKNGKIDAKVIGVNNGK